MKKPLIALLSLVAIAGVLCLLLLPKKKKVHAPKTKPPETTAAVVPSPTEQMVATAENKQGGLRERLDAIRKLPVDLAAAHVQRLKTIVTDKKDNETVRNDVLDVLERQNKPLPELGASLVAMWNDKAESDRWLDFTLQHFVPVYAFAENRREIEATLIKVAKEPSGKTMNFSGTALVSLQRLGEKNPELARVAAEIAKGTVSEQGVTDTEKGVAAFQALSGSADAASLESARKTAADIKALARLRMSAISLLGSQGAKDDAALLESLAKDTDSRVRQAAAFQLEELMKRLAK